MAETADKIKVKAGKRSISIPKVFLRPLIGMILGSLVTPDGEQILTEAGKEFLTDLIPGIG